MEAFIARDRPLVMAPYAKLDQTAGGRNAREAVRLAAKSGDLAVVTEVAAGRADEMVEYVVCVADPGKRVAVYFGAAAPGASRELADLLHGMNLERALPYLEGAPDRVAARGWLFAELQQMIEDGDIAVDPF